MKVLILGGTGVISREIVKQTVEKGFDVTMFTRGSKESPYADRIKVLTGDRNDKEAFARLMADVEADVVIDMICFNEEQARQTMEIFRGKVRQIIFTSSIAAYQRPYRSTPIREECELLREDPGFAYGYNKAQVERYLQSEMKTPSSTAITIIRPSLTFGPGAANFGTLRQNRNLVRRIRESKPVVMVGEGVIPWSFTFTPDLAAAYVLACGNEKTYNDYFHVTNTELVVWEDLYRAVGKAVGREPRFCYISSHILSEAYPAVCQHLNVEKVHYSYFSNEKFLAAAPEFSPKITLEEGVRTLVDWWEETDFPYDDEKDRMEDEICALYQRFVEDIKAVMQK